MKKDLIVSFGVYSRFNARISVRTHLSGGFSGLSRVKGNLVTFISGAFSTVSTFVSGLVFPKVESILSLNSFLSVLPRKPEPYGTANRPFVFAHQTKLRVLVETGRPLSNAAEVRIKYRKPSGVEGFWSSVIQDSVKGTILYDVVPPIKAEPKKFDFDEVGTWTVWSWVRFIDGREIPGDPVALVVYAEGSKEIRK